MSSVIDGITWNQNVIIIILTVWWSIWLIILKIIFSLNGQALTASFGLLRMTGRRKISCLSLSTLQKTSSCTQSLYPYWLVRKACERVELTPVTLRSLVSSLNCFMYQSNDPYVQPELVLWSSVLVSINSSNICLCRLHTRTLELEGCGDIKKCSHSPYDNFL